MAGLQLRDSQRQLEEERQGQNEARLEAVALPLQLSMDETSANLRRSIAALDDEANTKGRAFQKAAPPELSPAQKRRSLLRSPLAREVLILDSKGQLLSPQIDLDSLPAIERLLPRLQQAVKFRSESASAAPLSKGRWEVWFWQGGAQWLWVQQTPSGFIGIDLNRSAVLAQVLDSIPEDRPAPQSRSRSFETKPLYEEAPRPERFQLRNANDEILYQWGELVDSELKTDARLRLQAPLSMWTLGISSPPAQSGPAWLPYLGLGAGLAVAALIILLIAFFFYREQSREIREASQRVSFVNQVSHELKTPLTNIRLYGELARQSIDVDPEQACQQLDVIESESGRLGRLINNVLSFAQNERKTAKVHPRNGVPDDTVTLVLDQFESAFAQSGITPEIDLSANGSANFDPDLLEQILYNLLSNACKYAPNSPLKIQSLQDKKQLTIAVTDRGPGIAKSHRRKVFEPFYRISDAINEGQSGTGIGLGLARELAQLHGGELTLSANSPQGCCFTLTLPFHHSPS